MGLDVIGYSNLRYVGHCPDVNEDDHGYDPVTYDRLHIEAYAEDVFTHALMGVPNVRPHPNFPLGWQAGGCFAVTGKTETHAAGRSYSGYSRWRNELAQQFNPYRNGSPPAAEGPFYELLWFADNEGTLSQLCAVSLLGSFRQYDLEYASTHDEWDVAYYRRWARICELAADNGLIDFH